MNNDIVKKLKSRVALAVLTDEQEAINKHLSDVVNLHALIIKATGARYDVDLLEDLCRIQLGRNAHEIAKHNDTLNQ
jgi:hypothetical protein